MKSMTDLKNLLQAIDRRSYPAYKDTRGQYQFEGYVLRIEHVQSDPFAAPSRLSVWVAGEQAGFPSAYYGEKHQRIALQDHLLRLFGREAERYLFKPRGSGKSGLLAVSRCGQEVLERSACAVDPSDGSVTLRLAAGFPANGRTINAAELVKMLFEFLPKCVERALYYRRLAAAALRSAIELAEDQQFIRRQLRSLGLCAFVANGAVLPRVSGVSQKPLPGAVTFASPAALEVSLTLPHAGTIAGMGLKTGVTVIVGGGFHGKSTLLKALEAGVYDHVAGDGREYVITDDTAVKIRAEDGRSVKRTDISLFIRDLPGGKDVAAFYTEDASGSTSQAANAVEALEAGAQLFLIDEDTCATNFMIRDALMQRVVHREAEPIIPFIDRVRQLYEREGVSTVIVAGSSGMFFHAADCVIQMEAYRPREITALAKREAAAFSAADAPAEAPVRPVFDRRPQPDLSLRRQPRVRLKLLGRDAFQLERDTIDLRYVEQLADGEQTAALGYMLKYAERRLFDGKQPLGEIVAALLERLEAAGLPVLAEEGCLTADLAMPRRQEVFACLNRYRGLRL